MSRIMLKLEELAFSKALSTLYHSAALFKELRNALAARGKTKFPVVAARIRSTTAEVITTDSQRSSVQPTGKLRAIMLACLGDSSEPATRRHATGVGSEPL
jgi:hypothetical protein